MIEIRIVSVIPDLKAILFRIKEKILLMRNEMKHKYVILSTIDFTFCRDLVICCQYSIDINIAIVSNIANGSNINATTKDPVE